MASRAQRSQRTRVLAACAGAATFGATLVGFVVHDRSANANNRNSTNGGAVTDDNGSQLQPNGDNPPNLGGADDPWSGGGGAIGGRNGFGSGDGGTGSVPQPHTSTHGS